MACLCGHTMENVGAERARVQIFWCPRCGALKVAHDDGSEEVSPTELAGYIREAAPKAERLSLGGASYAVPGWHWRAACEAAGVKLP